MTMEKTSESETRRPGRPRSAQAHQAILDAALALLAEKGFEAMSIEEVAERAGVGKTTIYRRWSSKTELVIEALRNLQAEFPIIEIDTGSLRSDLIAFLQTAARSQASSSLVRDLLLRLVSELQSHPDFFKTFTPRLLTPRIEYFAGMVERAKARGELRDDLDWQLVLELVAGPIFYRVIFGDSIVPAPADWAERIVDALLQGLAPR